MLFLFELFLFFKLRLLRLVHFLLSCLKQRKLVIVLVFPVVRGCAIENLLVGFLPLVQYVEKSFVCTSISFGFLDQLGYLLAFDPQQLDLLIVCFEYGSLLQIERFIFLLLVSNLPLIPLSHGVYRRHHDLLLFIHHLQLFM